MISKNAILSLIEPYVRGWVSEMCAPQRIGAVIGSYLALPELRAFWPFSSVNESAYIMDLSGQGRTLANIGVGRSVLPSGIPFAYTAGGHLARGDEAGLDLTGAFTIGAWVFFNNNATVQESIFSKMYGTGGLNDNFFCARNPDGTLRFYVASGAAAYEDFRSTQVLYGSAWYHVAVGYTPSSTLRIYINGVLHRSTGTAFASINNSPAPFNLFTYNSSGLSPMLGNMALPFVCAAVVPDALIDKLYQSSRVLFEV